jgi:hypothetical protein
MSAKIPPSLIEVPRPKYTIQTIPIGSEYDCSPTDLLVDLDGTCYLNPKGETQRVDFMKVRRDDAGYHVTVLTCLRWTPQRIDEPRKASLIPVESVTVEKMIPDDDDR